MSDLNTVSLIGRVTRDGELKYTKSGTAVLGFGIAVNRSIPPADGGEWKNEASFFECQAWSKLAEQKAQILVKGKQIAIQGELRQDRWEQDGQSRSKVYIVANHIQALADPRPKDAQGSTQSAPAASPASSRSSPVASAQAHPVQGNLGDGKTMPKSGYTDDFTDDIPF